jgi:putative ABC transport system permease protein
MQALWQDLRYAARMLIKTPGFTLIAVVTLALGIGANTAIFTILNAVALRPFDFERPERLVICWESNPEKNLPRYYVSAPNFKDWQAQQSVFEQMAVFKEADWTLSGAGEPEMLTVGVMTAEMFALLRVKPLLGRAFTAAEEQPGREQVVVLTHKLWQRRFGGDRGVVGRNIALNGRDYSVIGVMDARFRLMGEDFDAFVPAAFTPKELTQRGVKNYVAVARLKDGVTLQRAQSEITAITERINQTDPEENEGFGALLGNFQTVYARGSGQFWGVLFTAVGFVLLIGCANLSNLLLARAEARQKEIAIRLSVGASRRRVIRQLLTESFSLALLGGALGLLLAAWGKDLIVALDPDLDYYRVKELGVDYTVLAFTLLLSLLTALLFGLAPAAHASNPNLNETLKDAGHSASGSARRHHIRNLLVISEVALAMVLLVGAGLTFRSMRAMRTANPGFNPHNLLTMMLTLSDKRYPDAAKRATFFDQLLPKLAALPGVQAVGLTNQLPISDDDSHFGFVIEGRHKKVNKNDFDIASFRSINPAFFSAMGMRMLRGRAFTERDNQIGPRVAIINETMAKRYWPNEDPLGKRLSFDNEEGKEKQPIWREIVGVVNDVKHQGLDKPPVAEVYYPYVQRPEEAVFLAVRSTVDPKGLIPAIRQQALNQDAEQALSGVETMEERMANFVASDRFLELLLGVFAALALLLAALGLYGVIAYAVAQRTREIGIRLALGAQPGDVLRLALKQGMLTVLLGVAVGLPLALGLTQLMKTMLFGVKETDPLTFIVMTLLLMSVALLACYAPARRATKVDPMIALRCE